MSEAVKKMDIPGVTPPAEPSSVSVQLVPYSDSTAQPPIGEVVERKLKEGRILKIGRQVMRDGQPVMRGNKVLLEEDIWFVSKVVSRIHAELWTKEGVVYIKDIGSSSGTFLNKMRLSPSGKESRPYPLKQGDIVQLGIDYKGKPDDIYKSISVKIMFHDQDWIKASRNAANHVKFRSALKSLLVAANPYASSSQPTAGDEQVSGGDSSSTDCCICIGAIAPYQALFIAPCSHCFHFKCVSPMVGQSAMFQCPLCRQVANLTASVSMESLDDLIDGKGTEPDAERHLSPLDQLTPITSSSPMSLDASYQLHSLRDGSVSPTNRDPSMPLDRSQNTVKASSTSKRTSFTSRLQSLLIRGAGGGSSEEAAGPSSSPSRSILVGSPPVASPQPTASAQPIQRLVPRSEAPHWLGDSRGRALESSEESEMDKSLNVEQFRESLDPRHPDPLAGQGPSTPGP